MWYLNKTLVSAAANVALDEALLQTCEENGQPSEWLRVWEPTSPLVVVGRASPLRTEVNEASCERDGVPIVRRCSGGAPIVAAPGCLMYAVVLSLEKRPQLQAIDEAHRFVLDRMVQGLSGLIADIEAAGTSDLAVSGRKISGNSLRCRRTHLLYHGTLLYDMSLALVGRYLRTPARQPDYRADREHHEFVANVNVSRDELIGALLRAWENPSAASEWPRELTEHLVETKYDRAEWNRKIE